MQQITDTILMVRPRNFRMNEQTATNNYYQKEIKEASQESLQLKAEQEFDVFVKKLRTIGIKVLVFDEEDEFDTPDAHFPNNWLSFHDSGVVALYPMFAENRRLERRESVLNLVENSGFIIKDIIDYTSAEFENMFLEGTGSLLLDRANRKAYCALSPRADEDLLIEFCEDFEYTPIIFSAYQTFNGERLKIYHTNVMMCLAEDFAVICLDCIDDKSARNNVIKSLKNDDKEIINISEDQVDKFAGNMLQLRNNIGKKYTIMSDSAYQSLTEIQIESIEKYSTILSSSLEIIETCGGGSARCMMAEVFLPKAPL
jgi:hypothetical protein